MNVRLTPHPVLEPGEGLPLDRPLAITVEHGEGVTRLTVAGTLDDNAAVVFRRRLLALLALPLETVTVDVTAAADISPRALEVLEEAVASAEERRIPLELVGITGW